jgi:DNA modification methylase
METDREYFYDLPIPRFTLLKGDCLETLLSLPDNSIDSVVCDPPYHLQSIVKRFSSPDAAESKFGTDGAYRRMSKGFMGQTWDGGQIAFDTAVWLQCYRVLKPGGHLIAFGGTRTIHRITCAIEDSGFDIRDQISWIQFQGFPKSLDISKQIDKMAGAEREVIGSKTIDMRGRHSFSPKLQRDYEYRSNWVNGNIECNRKVEITKPATPEAQKWDGWGTALKPSYEPAVLARKPISEANIAQNVLKWGTGGINVDACRFAYGDPCWVGPKDKHKGYPNGCGGAEFSVGIEKYSNEDFRSISWRMPNKGRWPANIYQCPKPPRSQKESGLEHLIAEVSPAVEHHGEGTKALNSPRAGAGRTATEIKNIHPTVKPIKLMKWLIQLITPPGGTVLDPFLGSGTTACAAIELGFDVVGCELTEKYWPIISGRTDNALNNWKRSNQQLSLF